MNTPKSKIITDEQGFIYTLSDVHISTIVGGSTILHDGHLRTVCNSNIKRSEFMGITIFGDSYRLGQDPVKRVTL